MSVHDAELDAILTTLEAAGLVEQYVNEDGKAAMRLTPKGAQLGRAFAMAGATMPMPTPSWQRCSTPRHKERPALFGTGLG